MGDQDRDLDQFIDFMTRNVPEAEVPAFFSSRVAHQAIGEDLLLSLNRVARRLIPVFATLILAVGVLMYRSSQSESELFEAELLFEATVFEEPITIEYVVSDLGLAETEAR